MALVVVKPVDRGLSLKAQELLIAIQKVISVVLGRGHLLLLISG